ncbi:MAG: hypothetical protein FJW35_07135, partial [Acidobacteria bacterium]|nr:hypothetical protein [Acidobacteriota bacterium]
MRKTRLALFSVLPILCIAAILAAPSFSRGKKALTFEDVMKFRAIKDPALSDDGRWIAFAAEPDRGDGEALVQSAGGAPVYRLERGSRPVFSKNSRWAAAVVKPSFAEAEKARAPGQKGSEPRPGLAILDTQTGEWKKHDKVDRFAFSDDSRWIALTLFKEEKKETATEPSKEKAESAKKKAEIGSTLQIVDLSGPRTFEIPFVGLFAFSPDSRYLAYTAQKPEGRGNGLYYRELGKDPGAEAVIARADDGRYSGLNWSEAGARLAFLAAPGADDGSDAAPASLHIWSGDSRTLQSPAVRLEQGWILPLKNDLTWTKDGKRLFFGRKPAPEAAEKADAGKDDPPGIYDLAVILKKREGDVWHWNDPRIVTQQKQMWSRVKDRTYRAVYHTDSEKVVALADPSLPDVQVSENAARALGSSDVPYLKEITWDGNFSDIYVIGLSDGSRKKVVERLAGRPSMSPQGRYVAYYLDRHWHLFDAESGTARNLTEPLGVTFADEDHDTPDDPPGYGVAGWTDSDEGVLINDKFDIWHFTTASGAAQNLTAGRGRREARIFRALRTDPEKTAWTKGETVLLSAYSDRDKSHGFYAGRIGQPGVEKRLEGNKRFRFLQKSKDADAIMFTRESYAEFPDLWVADSGFAQPGKLTEVNPQMSEFAWGDAELVDWHSLDGVPLQGVLIKPGNYEPGKRYPVIVYYYELSSQRLYEFNQPVVNHRPCF